MFVNILLMRVYTKHILNLWPALNAILLFCATNPGNAHAELGPTSEKYLKMGLGVQKHGVSDADIFHPYMLCTKIPSV